jgi:hypothetical protein
LESQQQRLSKRQEESELATRWAQKPTIATATRTQQLSSTLPSENPPPSVSQRARQPASDKQTRTTSSSDRNVSSRRTRPQRIPASKPEHLPSCTHTQARIKQNRADRLRPSSDPPGVAEKAASRLTDAYLPTYPSIGRLAYPCNAGRSDDKNR